MVYRFANKDQDYTDLSSGRVLYALPGFPALPVRVADEVFQRCMEVWKNFGKTERIVLYDPCCGGAYHLSVLGLIHTKLVKKIIGSDVNEKAVLIARKNLNLVSIEGLKNRIREIE